jgi:hypothetical protein
MNAEELANLNEKNLLESNDLERTLQKDLSLAIAGVLKSHQIEGRYSFTVYRDDRNGDLPLNYIDGKKLAIPLYCIGAGMSDVNSPGQIESI